MDILVRPRNYFNFKNVFINIPSQNTFDLFEPELDLGKPEYLYHGGRHREMVLGHHKGDVKLAPAQI